MPVPPVAAPAPDAAPARVRSAALLLTGILLVALNLRAAITSLGALLGEVSAGLHMSGVTAGVITTLPTLSFAAFGAFTPWLSRRMPAHRLLLAAMIALAAGQALRAFTASVATFVATSALALAGIAIANVLLPVLVREHFPHRAGLLTGVYTMTLTTGTSAAAATTVPIAHALGTWRAGLGVWALLALVALVPWLHPSHRDPARRAARMSVPRWMPQFQGKRPHLSPRGSGFPETAPTGPRLAVRRTRIGWAMAVYFGMQSLSGYATMGWLAQMFRDADFSPSTAGLLLAGVTAVGVPIALVMPALAARRSDLRPLMLVMSASMITAYAGLALAPHSAALLWIVLLAIGQGAFPMALTMIGMRARTAEGVVALSAFSQSTGYLLAAFGPLLVGVLYEATGGWTLPIGFLVAAALIQLVAGFAAARPQFVEDES